MQGPTFLTVLPSPSSPRVRRAEKLEARKAAAEAARDPAVVAAKVRAPPPALRDRRAQAAAGPRASPLTVGRLYVPALLSPLPSSPQLQAKMAAASSKNEALMAAKSEAGRADDAGAKSKGAAAKAAGGAAGEGKAAEEEAKAGGI